MACIETRGFALYRWVYDEARSLPEIQPIADIPEPVIQDLIRGVAKASWFHGIGKQAPEIVIDETVRDLRSLSLQLGKRVTLILLSRTVLPIPLTNVYFVNGRNQEVLFQ